MAASSFEDIDKIINKIFFQVINDMNVMDEKIFFVEKLEIYKDLADIATFALSVNKDINKNTFQKKTPEQAVFVNKLFTTFNNSIYFAKDVSCLIIETRYPKTILSCKINKHKIINANTNESLKFIKLILS